MKRVALLGAALATWTMAGCHMETESPERESLSNRSPDDIAQTQQALCPVGPAFPSCYGQCGALVCSPIDPGACCHCDPGCVARDDCCCDHETYCSTSSSCEGSCGGMAPAGCFCDSVCTGLGDCCDDFHAVCNTCEGSCGGAAPTGACFCDSLCSSLSDCCDDFVGMCLDWPKVFNGNAVAAVAADSVGNAYLATRLTAPWDAGGGTLSPAPNEAVVVSWDTLGTYRWARTFGGSATLVFDVAVAGDTVAVVGAHSGPLTYAGVVTLPAPATFQGYIVLINRHTGNLVAAAGSGLYGIRDVDVDAGSNFVFNLDTTISSRNTAGTLLWTTAPAPAPINRVARSTAGLSYGILVDDVVTGYPPPTRVVTFSASHALLRNQLIVNNGVVHDITTHGTDLYVTGRCFSGFCGGLIGGLTFTEQPFLAKINSSGTLVWSRLSAGGQEIAAESSGNISSLVAIDWSEGTDSIQLQRTSPSGTALGSTTLSTAPGAAGSPRAHQLAVSGGQVRYVTFEHSSGMTVDGTTFGPSMSHWTHYLHRLP